MTIVLGILIFGFLIFVHELGHFLTAKAFGIRVNAFAVGMGPAIFKKDIKGTEYSLRALPLGGYVKLEGEDEGSSDPSAFGNKSPLARFLVLFAGGFMNILSGFLLFVLLFSSADGVRVPVIESVVQGSPAAECGLLPGDKIIDINGSSIHIQNDVTLALMKNGEGPVSVTVNRDSEEKTFSLIPKTDEASGTKIIGFYPKFEKMTPLLAVKTAFHNTFFVVRLVYFSLAELIGGNVGLSDMAGPVGIVNEISAATKSGTPFLSILNFMGLIAVNLGVMNLLPIPALDGGRIFFVLLEWIRRKPINPEKEGLVHFIGFALLILLMIFITVSDIQKLFV